MSRGFSVGRRPSPRASRVIRRRGPRRRAGAVRTDTVEGRRLKGWTALLANHLAPGDSSARLFSYLKKLAVEPWEYVNWMTHAMNAVRMDAEIGLKAVEHLLGAFTAARFRRARASKRCEACGSCEVIAGVFWHCEWADPSYVPPEPRERSEEERTRRLAEPCADVRYLDVHQPERHLTTTTLHQLLRQPATRPPRGTTMLDNSVLLDGFNRLKSSPNAQRRGYALEQLLVQAFRQAHFKVEHDPGIATPRQTDLTAAYGSDRYLIEAKWESEPLHTGHIDDMRLARLGRTEGTVVGVIFSVSGFRRSATLEVAARRERSVLLFGEAELERILANPKELLRLLRVKRDELVIHGRVHLESSEPPKRGAPRDSHDLPGTGVSLLDADKQPLPYVTSGGGYGQFAFVQTLADIDWGFGVGFGVALDLPVRVYNAEGIVDLLYEMHRLGWVTNQPRWNIQQAGANWHGVGALAFVETLRDWGKRTEALEQPHHTEEVTYYDVCAGGFFTLTAGVASHESQVVYHCNISFQMAGVPLDTNPIRHLYETFNVMSTAHFRSLGASAATRYRPSFGDAVILEVVGFITEHHTQHLDGEERDWVTGVVAKNPYVRTSGVSAPEGWPRHLEDSELLICDLRSHHPLDEPRGTYHLNRWDLAWTSDALVAHIVADW